MSENKMSEIIRASIEGMRDFASRGVFVGDAIVTNAGVTVIPISKISVGFATGGIDYGPKKMLAEKNFGGGGGTGISITPIAFLTVNKNADINLISVGSGDSGFEKLLSLIEHSPELIEKIKDSLT